MRFKKEAAVFTASCDPPELSSTGTEVYPDPTLGESRIDADIAASGNQKTR
jgi:hypothetical protein